MPARDIFHDKVKRALVKDGWTITDDPYSLKWDDNENLFIDLAAKKLLAAQKDSEKIAVEIKTFIGKSTIQDLHLAVGQFVVYRTAIETTEPDRVLFLAVPMEILREVFERDKAEILVKDIGLKIIGFDVIKEVIVKWKK
ncbi:MAG: XisH family protein [Acidobacteria bacterium]|nr:XisH family protein [Acidobacteriota bacterium]